MLELTNEEATYKVISFAGALTTQENPEIRAISA
jgi:hypothetical protein